MTSGRLKRARRRGPAGQPRVPVGGRADPPELDECPGVLVAVDNAGPDPKAPGTDAHLPGARVLKVQPPRRRPTVPGVGWHDHRHILHIKNRHSCQVRSPGFPRGRETRPRQAAKNLISAISRTQTNRPHQWQCYHAAKDSSALVDHQSAALTRLSLAM